jgi:UDP-glucuronate decarboxylase
MNSPIIEDDLTYIAESDVPWGKLEGKNILITGANGMLPSYMVETILFLNDTRFKNKARVFAVVRNSEKSKRRFLPYLNREDLVFVVQDIIIPLTIREKIDYIFMPRAMQVQNFTAGILLVLCFPIPSGHIIVLNLLGRKM